MSKTKQAVFWIMAAPKGEKRTQAQASEKFDVAQGNISAAMKRMVAPNIRPDARRKSCRG